MQALPVGMVGLWGAEQLEALLASLPAACLDPPDLDLSDDDDEANDDVPPPPARAAADDGSADSDDDAGEEAASFHTVTSLPSGDSLFSPVPGSRVK